MAETLKDVRKLYGGEVEVIFYPNSHMYKIDGKSILSVTAATGIIDKPALKFWAVKTMREYLDKLLDEGNGKLKITHDDIYQASLQHTVKSDTAKEIGTAVHDWAERYAVSQIDKHDRPELPEKEEWRSDSDYKKVINGINAFLTWITENEVTFLETETIVYSRKFDYVGRFDAIATVNGVKTLIDYKTSSGIYSEASYQVGGYFGAWEEEHGKGIEAAVILNFSKETGELTEKMLSRKELEAHRNTFLHCLSVKKEEKVNNPYDYKSKQA